MSCSDPLSPLPSSAFGVLRCNSRGRILLTLRKRPPEAGFWSIVGGKLDFFEPLETCAIREALEEVGVEIAIDRLLCLCCDPDYVADGTAVACWQVLRAEEHNISR
jgi:8-oxo-dGTP pyrophosphatase MutT (NUDIX family)